jgi:hypothetical protein
VHGRAAYALVTSIPVTGVAGLVAIFAVFPDVIPVHFRPTIGHTVCAHLGLRIPVHVMEHMIRVCGVAL